MGVCKSVRGRRGVIIGLLSVLEVGTVCAIYYIIMAGDIIHLTRTRFKPGVLCPVSISIHGGRGFDEHV